ncbi:ATP-binding protein [Amycolatopsis sp. WAC 01376]|uniref:ATP-binding protein n=1 Tax=Amycolatopsis sp. WAC 01376 TaxID=2203195 RepID=UPI000F787161|nr:ATP-binding protein [Amycolatopsis sp. WAC 01376]RSM57435.1 ATP-binding protein [Amycolatopsis sp. WAC 01376]
MSDADARWRNTTHDWAGSVDAEHLALVRPNPEEFAPGGVAHLVLEVLAYAAEEAESTGGGHATVTVHPDGSVSVADDGRGTATRADGNGGFVKKPVMSTKDLRFFDFPAPIADDGTTGTTVRFLPGEEIGPIRLPEVDGWPHLRVECAR